MVTTPPSHLFAASGRVGSVVADAPHDSHATGVLAKKLRQISEREGEDAHITGGTRSLHRRLLALNLADISTPKEAAAASPVALTA